MSRPAILGILSLLLYVGPLPGQKETGAVFGTVTDASGRGASLAISAASPGGTVRSTLTSTSGEFEISQLLPGVYTLSLASTPALRIDIYVSAGSRVVQNFRLPAVPLPFDAAPALTQVFNRAELLTLPSLTRNAFRFSGLAGNLSDAGLGNRGVGFAFNGLRESSTGILLDGAPDKNEYQGAAGQTPPLDAVQELTIMTGSFSAEYGRAPGAIVSLVSRSGGSALHGSAWEFNRVSRLASNSFAANALGLAVLPFVRNQFGYSAGGPVRRTQLFFFSSTEFTRVRSSASRSAWLPAPEFLARSAPNTQAFFQTLGQLRPDARTLGVVTLNDLTALTGKSPCTGLVCGLLLPASLPLFQHVAWRSPLDAGAGAPQNAFNTFQRLDYRRSDATQFYARYALYGEQDKAGSLADSPYSNYDLGQSRFDQNFAASALHVWNPRLLSRSQIAFSRIHLNQQGLTSRGVVPSLYANPLSPVTIGSDPLAFPGYNPFTPGVGGAFGGPQNLLHFTHDVTWRQNTHSWRFGGDYTYIRDNRTDAAYQTAVASLASGGGVGPALNNLLAGRLASFEVAIDPRGKLPCVTPSTACSVTLPASSPGFSRSNRFHEGALYAQDFWRPRRRLAVSLGVRWDRFGVQHNQHSALDSNWYAPGIGFADDHLGAYLRTGGLQPASSSPVGGLWQPDWKDFAPRVGAAWDLFGNGRDTMRGGFGIVWDRNFGNVTFNVLQNLPNYAIADVPGALGTSNFGPLGASDVLPLPSVGARIIDPGLKTARALVWNASAQHRLGRTGAYSLEYSGSQGTKLYSISYPNQNGFGNFALGDPCTGVGDCLSRPNPAYNENVGYRGNQGFSRYQALNQRFEASNAFHTGLGVLINYTWSHAIDNLSSTFFEAGGQGIAGLYGGRNITTNNGFFDTGLLDPYHPKLDQGDADFDVRHRVVAALIWRIPAGRGSAPWRALLGGWSLAPVFTARSGQPFSVFNSASQTLDLSAPRAAFTGAYPSRRNSFVPSTVADVFHLITFLPAQIGRATNPLTPGAAWPASMSPRNSFRAPGFRNLDFALTKETRFSDRLTLQLRAEAYNALNHANLYAIGSSADLGAGNYVDACFGCSGSIADRRHLQLGARLIF